MKQRAPQARSRRRDPAGQQHLRRWEQAVKSRVVPFTVEKLSGSLRVAQWLPARYVKGRNSFLYHLPR